MTEFDFSRETIIFTLYEVIDGELKLTHYCE